MKKLMVILGLSYLAFLLSGCSGEGKAETANGQEKAATGTAVTVKQIDDGTFKEYLKLTGVIKANSQVQIVAEETGILVKIIRDKGSYVNAGQTLAVIENKVTEANAAQARALYKQAEINHNSSKVLYEKKAISENEFQISAYNLEAARAAYDLADARLQKLTIKAPISGFVNARYADLGGFIAQSAPLFELVDNSVMKVKIGVAERYLSFIKKGSDVELTFDAYPDMKISSAITFVARSVDPATRTFAVETEFRNPDGKLAPEMIANIRLLKKNHENSIVVPIDAVIDSETGRYVFIADDNIARKRMIEIVAIQGENVLVGGLNTDERLVVRGQRSLSDGDTLTIVQ